MHFLAWLLIGGGIAVAVFGTALSVLAASTPIAGEVSAAPAVFGIAAALVGAGMLVFG